MLRVLQEWWEIIKKNAEEGSGEFWGIIMSSLLISFFATFRKSIFFLFDKVSIFRKSQYDIPKSLKKYKQELDDKTLLIGHSWKIEGQTLKELYVPVNIIEQGKPERHGLGDFMENNFNGNSIPRLLVLGDAGSGKTVAMGFIARNTWNVKRLRALIPVLMSFSDIKDVKSDSQFEDAIIDNLERNQFGVKHRKQESTSFVKENLYEGSLILIIDGIDELERSIRFEIAGFLNRFFQKHQAIPFVISSRIAVWKQNPYMLSNLDFDLVNMADLSPFEIRQFVSQWKFDGNKSSDVLAEIINSKLYLKAIAVNPLILTILTFLYSQPKRVLPDNRVKFYSECIDALMEKWDNSKNLSRANQFETIDKVTILSNLAYQHITNSQTTDEDISRGKVLDTITHVMRVLSRPVEKREQMLTEMVQNAELLIELPPDSYKFPHRTFMEFFAANYFYEEKKHAELLNLYKHDKGKWQETLALYCGLNLNSEVSDIILKELKNNFIITQNDKIPDIFVFKALVESARISSALAHEILDLGDSYLANKINIEIIECLGYIAVNENWQHHEQAKKILLGLLSHDLIEQDLRQVVLTLVSFKEPQIKETIFKNLFRINLSEFLLKLGTDAEEYAIKLLDNVPKEKLQEIFAGLKGAGALLFLFNLMIKSTQSKIKHYAAWTLASTSESILFFNFIDTVTLKDIDPHINEIIDRYYKTYTWPKEVPKTTDGKKSIFLICYYSCYFIIDNDPNVFQYKEEKSLHGWIKYLVSVFLNDNGYGFAKYNLLKLPITFTKKGLISHWKHRSVKDSSFNFMMIFGGLYALNNIVSIFLYWKTSLSVVIIGVLTLADLITLVCLVIFDDKILKWKFYETIINGLMTVFASLIPILWLEPVMSLIDSTGRKYKYNPFAYLVGFLIYILLILIAPLPLVYKYISIALSCIYTICTILCCFINPIGRVFVNHVLADVLNMPLPKT